MEVVLAFAMMHVCLKAVKQLTVIGGQERAAGLNFTPGVVMTIAALLWISRKGGDPALLGLAAGNTFRSTWRRLGVVFLYLVPLAVFLSRHPAAPVIAALVFIGDITTTAIGEELFFRGCVQSRLNLAFGRPWRMGSVSFGPGLLLCSALFGFLHALNGVDYFRGQFAFSWAWAGSTFLTGVLFGVIREKTGGVFPCIVAHGLWNVWFLSFQMILRP